MTAKTSPLDPVTEVLRNAPEGEPLTEEERQLVTAARASIAAGRTRTPEQIQATIEAMRRKQEGG